MTQRTLTIIKPDSVANRNVGKIITHLEAEGFTIVASRMLRLSPAQAREFYAEHREKGFYGSLVEYMTSGPVWVMALEREDAVPHLRAVMGDTNPANAADGTIRKLYGESIERNSIHGSANSSDAARELQFFFPTAALL
jgi:nucleoside-diphosphate kinase